MHGGRGADPAGFGSHWHGGGGRGLRRFFAHGDLRLVILHLIAEKPRYGYEIIKSIEEQVGGTYSPSPGVVYPTLTHLEELGYVSVSNAGDGGRKLHEITKQGQAFLEANRPALEALLARMAEVSRVHAGGPPPQIVRAMENLKLALRLRLSRGPLTEKQAHAVAEVLDQAATTVERVQ
jgi:DNA-binding PadR family transcriptional regulator